MIWIQFSIRFGLALLLGAFIGAERQWRQRMAGLRTNALVAGGAAMFVTLAALAFRPNDDLHIAAQVVSGIGFLGAGVILRDGLNITGLNTAATLWCSAAIGVLAGYGQYLPAAIGTAGIVGANLILRPIAQTINRGAKKTDVDVVYNFEIICRARDERHTRVLLLHAINAQPLVLRSLQSEDLEPAGRVQVRATLSSAGRQELVLEQIVGRLSLEPGVTRVKWEVVQEVDQ
jgi:putative Mg2+ transporter-C (MgtC) family protein